MPQYKHCALWKNTFDLLAMRTTHPIGGTGPDKGTKVAIASN
jgi:hypothetical protein